MRTRLNREVRVGAMVADLGRLVMMSGDGVLLSPSHYRHCPSVVHSCGNCCASQWNERPSGKKYMASVLRVLICFPPTKYLEIIPLSFLHLIFLYFARL